MRAFGCGADPDHFIVVVSGVDELPIAQTYTEDSVLGYHVDGVGPEGPATPTPTGRSKGRHGVKQFGFAFVDLP